jgi:hypothetical protein
MTQDFHESNIIHVYNPHLFCGDDTTWPVRVMNPGRSIDGRRELLRYNTTPF